MNRLLPLALVALVGCKDRLSHDAAIAACSVSHTPADTTGLAGCLVEEQGWPQDSAANSARQVHDSVARALQQVRDDSMAAAAAEAALTQVNDAADQAKTKAPEDNYALAMIWVGSRKTKLYYRGHCAAAIAVRGADREEFSNDKMAERAGYQRSTAEADKPCYTAPGL